MNLHPWKMQKRIPAKREKIFKISTIIKIFKCFKNNQPGMMATDVIYEGGPSPVKDNCASLIFNVTPILTLLYTGHRLDLEQK